MKSEFSALLIVIFLFGVTHGQNISPSSSIEPTNNNILQITGVIILIVAGSCLATLIFLILILYLFLLFMRSNRRRRRREKREKYLNANKHDSEIEYTNFPEDEFELPETQGLTRTFSQDNSQTNVTSFHHQNNEQVDSKDDESEENNASSEENSDETSGQGGDEDKESTEESEESDEESENETDDSG